MSRRLACICAIGLAIVFPGASPALAQRDADVAVAAPASSVETATTDSDIWPAATTLSSSTSVLFDSWEGVLARDDRGAADDDDQAGVWQHVLIGAGIGLVVAEAISIPYARESTLGPTWFLVSNGVLGIIVGGAAGTVVYLVRRAID
ncbi:MAG: hypothetical protein ACRENI_05420 [Gemmatimonadaceae bacterium]